MIDSNGTVYVGRGFLREGQTTYESLTSYNNKAVSISFMLKTDEEIPNAEQQEALCKFIEQSIDDKALDENYTLFHQSALVSSYYDHQDVNLVNCSLSWRKRKALDYVEK